MNRVPPIGARVRFSGNELVGPCTGTVEAHYQARDEAGELLPECAWHVRMRVEHQPELWAYRGADKFAAPVSSLERLPARPVWRLPLSRETDVRDTFARVLRQIGPQRVAERLTLIVDEVRLA